MTRRALTLLVAGTLTAFLAAAAAVVRDLTRLLNGDPEGWRE